MYESSKVWCVLFVLFDRSPEWSKVSESQRKSLGIVNEDDGEFW